MATKTDTLVVERSEFENMKSKAESFDAIAKSIEDMGMMIDGLTNSDMAELVISLSTESLNAAIVKNLSDLRKKLHKTMQDIVGLAGEAARTAQADAAFVRELVDVTESKYMAARTAKRVPKLQEITYNQPEAFMYISNGEMFKYDPFYDESDEDEVAE